MTTTKAKAKGPRKQNTGSPVLNKKGDAESKTSRRGSRPKDTARDDVEVTSLGVKNRTMANRS